MNPPKPNGYNDFVQSHPDGTIHQLYEWGEFQMNAQARDRFWVVALQNEHNKIETSALLIKQKLPFGKCWLYSPRGPLLDYKKPEMVKKLIQEVAKIAYEQKAIFFRFDPPLEQSKEPSSLATSLFQQIKARPAHAHYQPESTLVVDLQPTSEEILKQMKPKGRYNIKVAQKHDVNIRVSDNKKEDIEAFYKLLSQTTARDKFSGHPQKYYEQMLKILGPKHAKLYLAEYKSNVVAAAIVTYFKDTATYYFGASSNEYRNVMAPYLLHWQAMLDAKSQGFHTYDFFGIAPENSANHPWASVTEFKLKFGGKRIDYIDAQEIVYQPFWYWLMRIAKKARAILPF